MGWRGKTLLFFLFLNVHLAVPAFAAPIEASFFSQGIWVKEILKLRVEKSEGMKKATFLLPFQADPKSLRLGTLESPPVRIFDVSWREKEISPDETKGNLKQKIEERKKNLAQVMAQMKAVESQLLFWQTQAKGKAKNITEGVNTAIIIGKNIKKLALEKSALDGELAKLDGEIRELEKEWDRQKKNPERVWEITALWEGDAGREITFVYSYLLKEGGWKSIFRLEAFPAKEEMILTWEGEIFQPTREDWKNVSIRVLDSPFSLSLSPPPLSPNAGGKSPPGEVLMWELGKRDLPAGKKERVKLKEERWPAEFIYLARPSATTEVFIQGTVKTPLPRNMKSEKALLLLDGTVVGKGELKFSGEGGSIFFGTDSAVKVTPVTMATDPPESKRLIKLVNGKDHPIVLLVEEPLSGKKKEHADPPPSFTGDDRAVWRLNLKAREEKTISIETSAHDTHR